MPRYVLKPQAHVDEYLIWSTVVDAPVSTVMTRAEMTNYLRRNGVTVYRHRDTDEEVEARLTRADINGHSLKDWNHSWWGGDEYIRLEECDPPIIGRVKHADIAQVVRAYESGDHNTLKRLIPPCEEEQP